ncbi:hypothetical protein Asphe3_17080 [Pseudarthrobacter phenanthrenivorans Sphe3]|uniref:Uncharacterized protein n=1 Tax=Pseudarthrobacter phenanthrenivorans (strain DSM 18606 / JCM 16027 / LMG 23796 / Sphe3) TaxID=930171 RepID=F0MAJ6_PSEPM|nr:hypothetical protein Asphe3_17080 [Pseudarthrobacter phenanthrenivorans Sphe3]
MEAIALPHCLSPEGGSTGARHSTRAPESLLAETMRGWEELDLVGSWRSFLDALQRYLRHL